MRFKTALGLTVAAAMAVVTRLEEPQKRLRLADNCLRGKTTVYKAKFVNGTMVIDTDGAMLVDSEFRCSPHPTPYPAPESAVVIERAVRDALNRKNLRKEFR